MAGKLDVLLTIIEELSEGLKTNRSIDNEIENELNAFRNAKETIKEQIDEINNIRQNTNKNRPLFCACIVILFTNLSTDSVNICSQASNIGNSACLILFITSKLKSGVMIFFNITPSNAIAKYIAAMNCIKEAN